MIAFFVITTWIITICIEQLDAGERIGARRNRIIPIDRLIRISELRRRVQEYNNILEIERYNKVMSELKNKIIIINPDEHICIGIEN